MKVLTLFSTSIGEIDWILPALVVLKRDYGASIVAAFHSPQLYSKLGQNPFLAQTLRDTAQICLEPRRHALAEHAPESFDVLLKDDTGDSFTPQRARYVEACARARNVVFPCSGVIYGLAEDTPESITAIELRVAEVMGFPPVEWGRCDLCLCGSSHDIPVLSLRYPPESIRAVGFPRYDEWWLRQLLEEGRGRLERERAFLHGRTGVLFVIRGPHPLYLASQDYDYLMRTFCAAAMETPGLAVVIKPHPRQSEEDLTRFLEAYPKDRFMISQQPIMLLATLSQAVVSMFSSGVMDALRVGAPTTEFYVYPRDGRVCLEYRPRPDGGFESVYCRLGLVETMSRRSQLKKFLLDAVAGSFDAQALEKGREALRLVAHRDDHAAARAAACIDALVAGRPF
ncbi:MAG: hypothetical protein ACOY4F_03055 [Thermodesulfobacteriota bacterium]